MTPFWFIQVETLGQHGTAVHPLHLSLKALMALGFRAVCGRRTLLAAGASLVGVLTICPAKVQAVSLDQACGMFASKLNAAVQAGDQAKAQTIYQEGTQRIAQRFNGATCPNVQPPASN